MKKYLDLDRKKSFKYDLAIVGIAKNEAPYIREWIAYYLRVSDYKVHIYIYDNESTDDLYSTVKDYVENGYVTYTSFPGTKMQLPAYDDAMRKYGNEVRYMAFVDIDEFIVPSDDVDLISCVKELMKNGNAGGIGLNWKLFGSAGAKKQEDGLVIERFMLRSEESFWGNEHVKSIVNPRVAKQCISCHYPLYKLGAWNINTQGKRQRLWINKNVDWSVLSVHHYFCKSEDEFVKKRSRGFADRIGQYDKEQFGIYDRNEVEDKVMERYIASVKRIMNLNQD